MCIIFYVEDYIECHRSDIILFMFHFLIPDIYSFCFLIAVIYSCFVSRYYQLNIPIIFTDSSSIFVVFPDSSDIFLLCFMVAMILSCFVY